MLFVAIAKFDKWMWSSSDGWSMVSMQVIISYKASYETTKRQETGGVGVFTMHYTDD